MLEYGKSLNKVSQKGMEIMNIDKILSDEYYIFLDDNHNVSFYSLSIGLEEYFETYHRICIYLSRDERDDKEKINRKVQKNGTSYIKSYLNIAIHLQHFFELETKRLLEKEHVLFAVDDKRDPIILNKLLKNITLDGEDTKNLRSIEFSEAIDRLKKLVENGILTDEVAVLFVNNYKLLKALNNLRNTIIHRGKRIMQYCELDEFLSQYVLPFLKEVLNCRYYRWHLNQLKSKGVYDFICNIIDEGKNSTISYSKVAFEKELARCNLIVYKNNIQKGNEKEENIKRIIARRVNSHSDEYYIKEVKCPCCEHNTMFHGRAFIGFDIDELGDETSTVGGFRIIHVPIYAEYTECGLCGFTYTDFIDYE